ncbi:MAG TPA: histidine ammonia-lyase [Actinomycetota bacterium]
MEPVLLGPDPLATADVVAVARGDRAVAIDPAALDDVAAARSRIEEHLGSGQAIYGITTGFGALAGVRVEEEDLARLQRNLIRSHAAGAGEPLPREIVRAMLLLRARALASGRSGVRPEVVERYVALLNEGITPAVPDRGSVGASGDLAQLAHIALAAMGEGEVLAEAGTEPSRLALARAGIEPLSLQAKEGLALINGTEGMLAVGVLAHHDAAQLLRLADVTAAMTIESALGTDRPFAEDLMALRPHPGQAASAENLRRLLARSEIVAGHRESEHAVQDPYSMRCAPQVHGATRDAHGFAGEVFARELGSVVDNPVILPDGRVESNGNFHGEPLAQALDFLGIALTGLASIAERRTAWILGIGAERGLPPFLSREPGLGSGYMLAQYTQAALVSECKGLAHPSSVDSIPTSGLQEDHVSMGWHGALRVREIVGRLRTVLAAEAMCGTQALDLRRPARPGEGTEAARAAIRERVPFLEHDREVAADLRAVEEMLQDGSLLGAVEAATGELR